MHRVIVVILLALLPQLVFAGPRAQRFCLTDDHVRVDCHDEAPVTACDEVRESTSGDQCIDIGASGSPMRVQRVASVAPELPPAPVVLVALILTPDTSTALPALPEADPPPAFSARAYCCSIALRC